MIGYNGNHTLPVHFVRYEDLYTDPETTLTELFSYILGVDSLEGTAMEARIKEVVKLGHKASIVYPMKANMKIFKSAPMFEDKELKDFIENDLNDMMEYFDYKQDKKP